jgi:hypothetical protein
MLENQRCSSCHARILWATSAASGKPIPLDPDPKVGGNVEVEGTLARVVPAAARGGRPLYVSHFATCANAEQHRKARP